MSLLGSRNSNLSAFNAININYSTLAGTTISLTSTMISLGQSTNKIYTTLAQGNFSTATNWVSTINTMSTGKLVAMSANAQTQLIVTQLSTASLYYTSSLQNWSAFSATNGLPVSTFYSSGAVSGTGQYQILGTNGGLTSTIGANGGGNVFISNNYGASFTGILANAPYIYLPFEDSTADVYGRIVTTTGTFTYGTGVIGSKAAFFNNFAGGAASHNVAVAWPGAPAFTITGWFYATGFGLSGLTPVIFGTYGGAAIVYINNSGTVTASMPSGGGSGTTTIATSTAITINTWYSFAYIFQSGGTCSFYLNNVLVGSATNTGGTGSFTATTVSFGSGSGLNVAFAGYLDDLRVYNNTFTYPMNYNNVAVSNSGQYMLATVLGGGIFMSVNYGLSWTQVTSQIATTWLSAAISASGQYMLSYATPVVVTPQLASLASNTWQVNGVNWTASASSTFNAPVFPIYMPFVTNPSSGWNSSSTYNAAGSYTGSASTYIYGQGNITGEWLQLQSSVPLQMFSYTFRSGGFWQFPKSYTITGSNDGITWYLIQSVTFSSNPYNNTGIVGSYVLINYLGSQTYIGNTAILFTPITSSYSNNSYLYFRLITPTLFVYNDINMVSISGWYINFYQGGGQAYSTNFGSTWQNGYALDTPSALSLSGSGQYALAANSYAAYVVPNYLSGFATSYTGQAFISNTISYSSASGTLAYYSFNDVNTSVLTETIRGNNATITGTVTLQTTGKVGTSAYFNGGYVTTASGLYSLWNNLTAGSIAFWIYPTASASLTQSVIFRKQHDGVNTFSIVSMGYYHNGATAQLTAGTPGKLYFSMTNSQSSPLCTTNATLSLNTWTHVVITFTGSVINFYINGALDSGSPIALAWTLPNDPSPTSITIGASYISGYASTPFYGYIDEFSLWNTALTPSIITSLYNTLTPANITGTAISTTGQYMVLVTNNTSGSNVYYSNNYGANFTGLTIGSTPMTSCSISADGSYITVTNGTTVYQLNNNSNGFSLALGNNAGVQNQGQNAIAIGNYAGQINQTANSIVLNASGSAVNPITHGFYVAPIAQYTTSSATLSLLAYGTDNQVVQTGLSINSNPNYQIINGTLSLLSSGNVGIGSTVPQYALDVNGITRSTALQYLDGSITLSAAPTFDYTTFGQNWVQLSLTTSSVWYGCAISYSGQYQLLNVASGSGAVWYSLNYGQSWTQARISVLNFGKCYVSGSGQYQLISVNSPGGVVYVSSNYGVSWTTVSITSSNITGTWSPACISYTGQYMSIAMNSTGSYIYYSNTYGQTWTQTSISSGYSGLACSASGQYQIASANTNGSAGFLYLSTNYGASWISVGSSQSWTSVCVSATGQYMSATFGAVPTIYSGGIYYSSNYGQTWTLSSAVTNANYQAITCSSSGQYQLTYAFVTPNYTSTVYYSTNYGQTWTVVSGSYASMSYITMSGNGQYALATVNGGGVYQSVTKYPPLYLNGTTNVAGNINLTGSILYNGTAITTGTGSIWTAGGGGVAYYSGGNVGIGTATPLSNTLNPGGFAPAGLDIQGSTVFDGATILRLLNPASQYGRCQLQIIGRNELGNDGWNLQYGRNILMFGYQTSFNSTITYANAIQSLFGALGFLSSGYSNDVPALTIAANGNIGIGIGNPSYPLHIYSSSSLGFVSYIQSANPAAYTAMFTLNDTGNGAGLFLNGSTRAADGGFRCATLRNDGGNLRLSAASDNPYIFLNSSTGNVGIGVSTPSTTLDVNGTISRNGLQLPRVDYGTVGPANSITIPILFSNSAYNFVEIRFRYECDGRLIPVYLSSTSTSSEALIIREYGLTTVAYNAQSAPSYYAIAEAASVTFIPSVENYSIVNHVLFRISRNGSVYINGSVRNHFIFDNVYCLPGTGTTRGYGMGHIDIVSAAVASITITCASGNISGNWNTTHYN